MKYTNVTLDCDIPEGHSEGEVKTVSFELDGKGYEIDLCPGHQTVLATTFDRYVTFASSLGPTLTLPPRKARTSRSRRQSKEVRAWAKGEGLELSDKGRIPVGIRQRYEEAQGLGR